MIPGFFTLHGSHRLPSSCLALTQRTAGVKGPGIGRPGRPFSARAGTAQSQTVIGRWTFRTAFVIGMSGASSSKLLRSMRRAIVAGLIASGPSKWMIERRLG